MSIRQLLAAVVLCTIVMFGLAGNAHAASCSQVIGDDAGLFGAQAGAVEAAANRLANQGALVRVRTTATLVSGELDGYMLDLVRNCPEWRNGNDARDNLLLLVLYRNPSTTKGKANVYAGGRFQARLNAQWQGIKSSQIGPNFNAGNYVGAAVGGLNGIATALGGSAVAPVPPPPVASPPVAVPPASMPAAPAPPAGVPGTSPAQPAQSGGSGVLWALLAIVLLGGGGAAWYFVSQKKKRARLAQQDAKNVATSCATEIETFSDAALAVLTSKVTTAAKGCSDADAKQLVTKLAEVKFLINGALATYGRCEQSANPSSDGKTAEEYVSMRGSYENILKQLDAAKKKQLALEAQMMELQTLADRVGPAAEQAEKDIAEAAQAIVDAQEAGFFRASESALVPAIEDRDAADEERKGGRLAAASKTYAAASAKAKAVTAEIKGLPARKSGIEKVSATISAGIASATSALVTAKAKLADFSNGFAQSSWATVDGHGAAIEKRIASATAQCAEADAALKDQRWDEADGKFAEAGRFLKEAESFMSSIAALKTNLELARTNAPAKLAQASQDIAEAQTFIRTNEADIEDVLEGNLVQRLRRAIADLPGKEVLRLAQPDYPAVIARAQDASKVAAEILKSARSDQENTRQQRALAATAVQTAKADISVAKEYIQDHRRVVGGRCDADMSGAHEWMSAALGVQDPTQQRRHAQQAAGLARQALELAQRLVADERESRRRAEAARQRARHNASSRDDGGALLGGLVAGAVIGAALSGGSRSSRGGGGLMGGNDDLSGPSSGGGGLMSGSDDVGGTPNNSDDL